MNKFSIPAIVFFIVLTGLNACKKSKSVTIPVGISATIAGSSWTATKFYFDIDTGSSGNLIFHVFGGDTVWANTKAIALWTEDFRLNKNTYTFGVGTSAGAEYNDHTINAYHPASSGSFQLTSLTPDTAIGTFSFTTNKYSIQNGRFKVPRKI